MFGVFIGILLGGIRGRRTARHGAEWVVVPRIIPRHGVLVIAVVNCYDLLTKTEYNIHLRAVGTEMDLLVRRCILRNEILGLSGISIMMITELSVDYSFPYIVSWDFRGSRNVSRVRCKELSA